MTPEAHLAPTAARVLMVGDSHGNSVFLQRCFIEAKRRGADCLIQLGDYGYWPHVEWGQHFLREADRLVDMFALPLIWIAGNHENWEALNELERNPDGTCTVGNTVYAPRGTFFKLGVTETQTFASGGSWSLDWRKRVKYVTYWPEEELTAEFVDSVPERKVELMLSHDAPVAPELAYEIEYPASARQRELTTALVAKTRPDMVFCGHHHHSAEWTGPNGEHVHVLSHDGADTSASTKLLNLEEWRIEYKGL